MKASLEFLLSTAERVGLYQLLSEAQQARENMVSAVKEVFDREKLEPGSVVSWKLSEKGIVVNIEVDGPDDENGVPAVPETPLQDPDIETWPECQAESEEVEEKPEPSLVS